MSGIEAEREKRALLLRQIWKHTTLTASLGHRLLSVLLQQLTDLFRHHAVVVPRGKKVGQHRRRTAAAATEAARCRQNVGQRAGRTVTNMLI